MKKPYLYRWWTQQEQGLARFATARCPLDVVRERAQTVFPHDCLSGYVEVAALADGHSAVNVSWKRYFVSLERSVARVSKVG